MAEKWEYPIDKAPVERRKQGRCPVCGGDEWYGDGGGGNVCRYCGVTVTLYRDKLLEIPE